MRHRAAPGATHETTGKVAGRLLGRMIQNPRGVTKPAEPDKRRRTPRLKRPSGWWRNPNYHIQLQASLRALGESRRFAEGPNPIPEQPRSYNIGPAGTMWN